MDLSELIRTLDDPAYRRRLDPSDMAQRIGALSLQCREAWQRSQALALPPEYRAVDRVVVAGMGGSAVGGDLLASLALPERGVSVSLWRQFGLPPWVDARTLVIVSSYSGNTQETLSAYETALQQGAKVIALTAGGRLGHRTQEQGVPTLLVPYRGQPRTALGYSFIVPLTLAWRLGLLPERAQELEAALELLEGWARVCGPDAPVARNPAKQLAGRLSGRIAIIYGADFLSAVARRWKTQINENAKEWAFAEELTELTHNAMEGYRFPSGSEAPISVVLLQSHLLEAQLLRACRAVAELLSRLGIPLEVVEVAGPTPLAQMLQSLLLGDFTSYYLALLNGVDPVPTPSIDWVKDITKP